MIPSNIAIEAKNLSFSYNGTVILDHLTFSIESGAYVGIIGPNGGGKTTLIKLILGLLDPTQGSLNVLGQSPKIARGKGRLGYVLQRIAQGDPAFPATVEEVVKSGRSAQRGMFRWLTVEDRRAVEAAMEKTDILPFRKRLIGSLSGGERQRAFIARALVSDPQILVLDEPTTGIDPAARESFYALLRQLNQEQHIGILFVSHDLEVMIKEANSLLCINKVMVCNCESGQSLSPGMIEQLYGKNVSLVHHTH